MSNNQSKEEKLATNGYQPMNSSKDKCGYQPPKNQSGSSQGTPPKKP